MSEKRNAPEATLLAPRPEDVGTPEPRVKPGRRLRVEELELRVAPSALWSD